MTEFFNCDTCITNIWSSLEKMEILMRQIYSIQFLGTTYTISTVSYPCKKNLCALISQAYRTLNFLSKFCETIVASEAYVALAKTHKFVKEQAKIPLKLFV